MCKHTEIDADRELLNSHTFVHCVDELYSIAVINY